LLWFLFLLLVEQSLSKDAYLVPLFAAEDLQSVISVLYALHKNGSLKDRFILTVFEEGQVHDIQVLVATAFNAKLVLLPQGEQNKLVKLAKAVEKERIEVESDGRSSSFVRDRLPGPVGGQNAVFAKNMVHELHEYGKIFTWSLEGHGYEKILYLGAEMDVLGNMDEIFDLDADFAAVPNGAPSNTFDPTVMLIKPNRTIYNEILQFKTSSLCQPNTPPASPLFNDEFQFTTVANMLNEADSRLSYDGTSTGFLNRYFHCWYHQAGTKKKRLGRLHPKYNAELMGWSTFEPGWRVIGDVKGLHYGINFPSTPVKTDVLRTQINPAAWEVMFNPYVENWKERYEEAIRFLENS